MSRIMIKEYRNISLEEISAYGSEQDLSADDLELAGKKGGFLSRHIPPEAGMGVVEVILITVEKPNAKHRYVLCGN